MPEAVGFVVITITLLAIVWNDIATLHRSEREMNDALEQIPEAQWNRYGFRARNMLAREYLKRGGNPRIAYEFNAAERRIMIAGGVWFGLNLASFLILRVLRGLVS